MKYYLCNSEKIFKERVKLGIIKILNLECCDCGLVFLDSQDIDDSFYTNGNMHDLCVYQLTQRTDFVNDTYLSNKSRLEFCLNSIVGKDILDFGSGYIGFFNASKILLKVFLG
ncbi:hypothetical protein ACLBYY_000477 [Campylobacter jejuni]